MRKAQAHRNKAPAWLARCKPVRFGIRRLKNIFQTGKCIFLTGCAEIFLEIGVNIFKYNFSSSSSIPKVKVKRLYVKETPQVEREQIWLYIVVSFNKIILDMFQK